MNRLRAVALATASASVRIFFIRASGANGLPLTMPIAASGPISSGIERGGGFLLHDLVQHLEVAEVVGRHGVHRLAAAFVEHGRRRRRDPAEPGLAGQELGDRRADAAGLVGVDLGELPDRSAAGLRIVAVLQERAAEPHDAGGPGAGDEKSALRQRAVVVRRQDQVLAAFAAIGAGQADVGDPAEPVVVDGAEKLRAAPPAPSAPW